MTREPIFASGALPTLLMFGAALLALPLLAVVPWTEIATWAGLLTLAFPGIALLLVIVASLVLTRLYFGPAPSEPVTDAGQTVQAALWWGILIGAGFAALALR